MKKIMLVVASLLWAICFTLAYIANADAAPRAISGFFKQVHHHNDMDRDGRGEYELFRMSFAGLGVNKEIRAAYPLLTQTIERMNKKEWQCAQENRTRMKGEAAAFRQENPNYYHPFAYNTDVLMRRADTMAVSFLQYNYTGGSGVHGIYAWHGVNLNTVTGTELPLEAVITDQAALAEAICERLRQDYPQSPFDKLEESIAQRAAEGTLNWTLDPQGITFYFNPYEIASYAEGLLTATILFKEKPALFQSAFCETPAAYAQPFIGYYPVVTSLKDNSQRDVISLRFTDKAVYVKVNDVEEAIPVPLKDLEPVLIHMEDGRNYLYIDGLEPSTSVRKTLAVQIGSHSVHYIDTLPYSFRQTIAVSPAVQEYWNFLTNPNGFYFDQSSGFTSTSKTDICSVNEKGTLAYG